MIIVEPAVTKSASTIASAAKKDISLRFKSIVGS